VLHVNRSTYYNFINKKPSKREIENQGLRKLLLEIYMKAKKRIGTRAFKIILLCDYGINISEGRILRLLNSMTLPKMSTIKPRFKSRKLPEFTSENLLKQDFNPKVPNQVWTTDFTYISIGYKRHVYLCAILDLYSRKCIAWKLSHKIDAKLACDTLQIAIDTRRPTEPILFHSDQGSQFKSEKFRKLLDEHQLLGSYSNPGYPYDNAVTEVFFKYLKQREINRRTYHSIQEVQLSCFEYIEQFYNNYNPHSANNGLTPNQKEENYFKKWKVN
ncbi:IS3 family transposase, partial [Lactococcus lactis]|uniref:IS3 family transposase n=1 Tax=Lactococcus lactis TaxID=1358 RepID=UPI0018AB08F0